MTPLPPIRFSILVCAIPRRLVTHTTPLLQKLCAQAEGKPVEVLCLFDNKTRKTGTKRQALLEMARGDYVAFIDDDDDVTDDYVAEILAALDQQPGVDAVVFPMQISTNGTYCHTREHGIHIALPMHTQVWRRELALQGKFPDITMMEDEYWTRAVRPLARTEVRIPKILYFYRWEKAVSESFERC